MFKQIVVELHFYGSDLQSNWYQALLNLTTDFKVVHLHCNPYIPEYERYIDDGQVPRVLEVTLLRNDLFNGNFKIDMDGSYPDKTVDTRLNVNKPLDWWKS